MLTNNARLAALLGMVMAIGLCMLWIDRPVAEFFKLLDRTTPQLVAPFKFLTDAGKSHWFLLPLAAWCAYAWVSLRFRPGQSAVWRPRLAGGGFIFTSVAASGLLTNALKILAGRSRPVFLDQDIFNQFTPLAFDAKWWSFPSGHSTTVMALALAVGVVAPRWRWPFLIFAGIIMASRVIVAAHYPADLLGGVLVAILTHSVLLYIFVRRRWDLWAAPHAQRPLP
ncbi:MAG: phosphatase PAP2 family protein [Alphaproteobacteria bacterium]